MNILVLNRKGGCGKTTIADEIMFSLERSNIPAVFVDLDDQQTSAHQDDSDHIDNADVLVIDTPGALSEHVRDWVADADVVVIPTNPSARDIPMLLDTLETARTYGPDARRIIVVNRVTPYTSSRQFLDAAESIREGDELLTTIHQSEIFQRAFLNHRSVLEEAPRSPVTLSILQTVNAVRKAAGLPPDPTDPEKLEDMLRRRRQREQTLKEIRKEKAAASRP